VKCILTDDTRSIRRRRRRSRRRRKDNLGRVLVLKNPWLIQTRGVHGGGAGDDSTSAESLFSTTLGW